MHLVRLVRQARDRANQQDSDRRRYLYKLDDVNGRAEREVCRTAWARVMGIGESQLDDIVNFVKNTADTVAPDPHGNTVSLYVTHIFV